MPDRLLFRDRVDFGLIFWSEPVLNLIGDLDGFLSFPGLTRESKKTMDCRVKHGNDKKNFSLDIYEYLTLVIKN